MDISFVSHWYNAEARAFGFSFFSVFLPFIVHTGQVQGSTEGRETSARKVKARGSAVTFVLGGWVGCVATLGKRKLHGISFFPVTFSSVAVRAFSLPFQMEAGQ